MRKDAHREGREGVAFAEASSPVREEDTPQSRLRRSSGGVRSCADSSLSVRLSCVRREVKRMEGSSRIWMKRWHSWTTARRVARAREELSAEMRRVVDIER